MIYLSIDKNTVKLLALTKAMLGQYSTSFFQKTHESELLENGKVKNVDLLASAIKEALTLSSPKELKDKEVTLILPQETFNFKRIDVPFDISESAILPFVKDKVRSEIAFDLDTALFDYMLMKQGTENKVLFFALSVETFNGFQEVFKLLGLSLKAIIPETLAYYKLFEKTLKKDKKENILYVNYEDNNSFGYLYDSLGLLRDQKITFTDPIETSVKAEVDSIQVPDFKLNRIILSGEKSDAVRQDFFTKDVGVWTNPLKKIISNFYTDYLKLLVMPPQTTFSYLEYAVALGGFIFSREHESFNVLKKSNQSSRKLAKTGTPRSFNFLHLRDVGIFIAAFVLSFVLIYFFPKIYQFASSNVKLAAKPTPIPTAKPQPTATPTPAISRETLKVKILNGGGVAGKATKVKDILKEKGYTDIVTGNADTFDFKNTKIQTKPSAKGAIELLKQDLADYTTTIETATLNDSETADVIITIGSDFK